MKPQPLEIEIMAGDDAIRLQTATDAARPLPASAVEELVAELRRIEAERKEQP